MELDKKNKIEKSNKEENEIQNRENVKDVEEIENEPINLEKISELLTNNLKWSQIIYEQNRKINRKLLWNLIFNYLKNLIIIAILIISFFYLLPTIDNFLKNINTLFNSDIIQNGKISPEIFTENLFKQINLDQAKQEQLKGLLR